jgi:regulatory protein
MPHNRTRTAVPPLDEPGLNRLALRYVEKFATTRSKLRSYLDRKVRERGWSEGSPVPDTGALAERFAEQGYVDDAGYALMKSRSLAGRGYGKRRLGDALRAAGVAEPDASDANSYADEEALAAAVRFAERRRIGPFARAELAPADREKAIGAMIRAGHGFALARKIAAMPPSAEVDPLTIAEELRESD